MQKFENVGLNIALVGLNISSIDKVRYLIYFESKEIMRSNFGNETKKVEVRLNIFVQLP